jgi:hypothetical protein
VPDNGGDHSGGGGSGGYVDDVFSTYLYEGTSADQDIVNGVDLDGEGGLVWIKSRTSGLPHFLFDTERGANRYLKSNESAAEEDAASGNMLTAFNSDGFNLGDASSSNGVNRGFTSWTFRKAPSFFDVVTYTGDGVKGREIPHNLGVDPGMIIFKHTDGADNWFIYHRSIGADNSLMFTSSGLSGLNVTNNTAPTDTTFTVTSLDVVNQVNGEFVAYLFAHDDSDEGLIQCGSFSSTSASSIDIDLGWEPQWLLVKTSTSTGGWAMFDSQRGFVGSLGGDTAGLVANEDDAEATYTNWALNSRGFSYLETSSGRDFIYMAIRRPNKPAEEFEPEELFAVSNGGSTGSPIFPGILTDFQMHKNLGGGDNLTGSRLQGANQLVTNANSAESANADSKYDFMEGWGAPGNYSAYVSWMWRRAPGFFDVVVSEATNRINHNLGVIPEVIWSKQLDNTSSLGDWTWNWDGAWFSEPDHYARLHWNEYGKQNHYPNNGVYTSTDMDWSHITSYGGTWVFYLFASVPGICDIGTYTGTGGEQDIDCGFTNGARFVLIKRVTGVDSDWMFFDTLRGISSSDSPLLALNKTDAQVSGSYIKPNPKGFTATGNLTGIDGGEYVYMAIA